MARSKSDSLRRLLGYFRAHAGSLAFNLVCVAVISATTAGPAYLAQPILDRVLIDRDLRALVLVCVAAVLLFTVKGIFRYLNAYTLSVVGHKVTNRLRDDLYRHFQYLSIRYYTETHTGTMMSRIINDVQMMQRAVPGLVDFVRQPLTLIALVAVAVHMNWRLALIAAVALPATVIPIERFGKRVRKWSRRGQERMAVLTSVLKENFSGMRVIKAFGMEEREIGRFAVVNRRVRDALVKQVAYDELAAPVIEFFAAIAAAAVIYYGGLMVIRGQCTSGQLVAFLVAAGSMYEPIKKLSKVNVAFQQALAAADRIFEILDTATTVTDRPGAADLPAARGEVRFEHVRFRYEEAWVLDDVDFTAAPGQTVALVGSSGAGKTTLVDLIPRFYDVVEGAIRIDGRDVRDVTLASLRRQIAIVTQDVFLFDDTIAGNIAYGQVSPDPAAIEAAAEAAHADGFIRKTPKGYETRIGELGVRLSGGQRQRLSIARALYKNAPILILDEATSALDTESEIEVQSALENLMRGRTTFVIAHRLSTVRNADRILVLQGGRIVEDGRHEDLLARGGVYGRLYQLQFRDQ
jgi:subfamily B ATP-binding cassette protein MsbA